MRGQPVDAQINKVISKVGWNAAIMGAVVLCSGIFGETRTQLAISAGGAITLLALIAGIVLCIRTRFHKGVYLTVLALAEIAAAAPHF